MDIKVQHIAVANEADRKSKLAKMRASIKNNYDYAIDYEASIVRYSANKPGAILPQIYLETIKEQYEDDVDSGKLNILLRLSDTSLMIIYCTNWEVYALDTVFIDKLESSLKSKIPVFYTDDIELPKGIKNRLFKLPLINQSEVNKSPYQLKDKYNKKLVKQLKVAGTVTATILLGFVLFSGDDNDSMEVKPEKKVVQIKKQRKDVYYEYKKSLVGKVLYSDIFPSLVTASLMASTIPENWAIEEVFYDNHNVHAQIKHNHGETTQLKYYRDSIQNGRYITIDGQKAMFQYPIIQPSWFKWTKHKSDFVKTRDQLMDLMINLGGKMGSREAVYNQDYTTQAVSFYFDEVSLAYLEVFNYIFQDKPIFIDSVTIKPIRNNKTMASIEIQATIIGI